MKILFLEPQPCIRAYKYALGLQNRGGHELTFGYTGKTLSEFYGTGDSLFKEWVELDSKFEDGAIDLTEEGFERLRSLLDSDDFDIVHSHNAPDHLTVRVIDAMRYAKRGIPVVHDNHDIITMRRTPYGKKYRNLECVVSQESIANTLSDARIFVSEGLMKYAMERYGSKGEADLVFKNFVPEDFIPRKLLPKLSETEGGIHIVYEGTVDEERTGAHYDLLDIFDEITRQGFHLHIYTTLEADYYKELSRKNNHLHFHGRKDPAELMREMTQYDFGWAGFNSSRNATHLDVAMPNKTMEYISAGLPVISFPHKTQKAFLESKGLGIVISSVDELSDKLNGRNIIKIREEVQRRRLDFTVERNIGWVEEFYKRVIDNHRTTPQPKSR